MFQSPKCGGSTSDGDERYCPSQQSDIARAIDRKLDGAPPIQHFRFEEMQGSRQYRQNLVYFVSISGVRLPTWEAIEAGETTCMAFCD